MAYKDRERRKAYSKAYRQRPEVKAREEAVRGVIKGIARSFGCAVCGQDTGRLYFHRIHLHFHHINPSTKRANVSSMTGYSWASIFAEIDKCEVLCPKCHKKRHQKTQC